MTVHFTGPVLFAGKDGQRKWFADLPVSNNPDYVVYMDDFTGIAIDKTNDWTELKDTDATVAIGADVLAMTALNAFRPRRWRGALLPKKAHVRFEVMDPEKRPVMADADSTSISNVAIVDITSEEHVQHRLLFDPGHGLDERLLQEQFV